MTRWGFIDQPTTTRPFGSKIEQALDAIALGLELEQNVGLLGKIRNQLADHAGVRLQRETIGDLAGADAKKNAAMTRQRAIGFVDQSPTLLKTLSAELSARYSCR